MPEPGMRWRHAIINTKNTWLHRDERGFRSRKHRIHSSGDYKHRPPADEHQGLREYHRKRSGKEVHIAPELRSTVGCAILLYFRSIGARVIAMAVGKVHTHIVVEMVDDIGIVKRIIGQAKRRSSRAVKSQLPGAVWGEGGTFEPVDDRERLERSHDYVIYDQGPGAWTWSFRDNSDEGMFGRQ